MCYAINDTKPTAFLPMIGFLKAPQMACQDSTRVYKPFYFSNFFLSFGQIDQLFFTSRESQSSLLHQ